MAVHFLTDSFLQQLTCPIGKSHFEVFDTHMKGFYVDVLPNGRMSFRVRYMLNKQKKLLTLGNARVINVAEGREKARQVLYQVATGLNPRAHKPISRASENQYKTDQITLVDFFQSMYLPFVKGYKRSWKCDLTLINNHIKPHFANLSIQELSPVEIAQLINTLRQRGYAVGTCNRVLVLLRYAYTLAMKWKVPGVVSNPAKELPNLKQDNRIEKYLSPEDAIRLMASVRKSDNPLLQYIVPFLIYTGARKREVLDAKWQDIDWQEKSWRIPLTKSGKVRHVPLSEGAIDELLKLKSMRVKTATSLNAKLQDDWIFANPKTNKPYVSIFYSWDTARKMDRERLVGAVACVPRV